MSAELGKQVGDVNKCTQALNARIPRVEQSVQALMRECLVMSVCRMLEIAEAVSGSRNNRCVQLAGE